MRNDLQRLSSSSFATGLVNSLPGPLAPFLCIGPNQQQLDLQINQGSPREDVWTGLAFQHQPPYMIDDCFVLQFGRAGGAPSLANHATPACLKFRFAGRPVPRTLVARATRASLISS